MKNITKKILSILMVLAVLFVFASCNEDTDSTTDSSSYQPTSLSSSEKETTGSSETSNSKETTSSSDTSSSEETTSSSETESTKPHEHVFGEWTVTKNATCTADGIQERSCSCGEKETQAVKASGHVILTIHAKPPTCTEEGFTEKQTCSVCNEILKQSQTVPATGHGWGEGKITKEPTETETGIRIFTCGACGETKTESIPALEHTHKYAELVTEPTCTEKGYTTHKCSCGDSYVDSYVNAKGHTEAVVKGKDATCTETGLTDGKKCSVCGIILVQQETIAAKGHAWDNGKITKEPTETETGIKTFTCANCKETKTETLPVLSHTHKHTATVTAPTCTEKGYTTYNCACGDSYVDNYVDAKGHTESVTKGKDATCTENGLTNGKKCSVCGETLLEQQTIPAKGHAWDNGKVTKEPTETETGIKTFTCTSCKETKTETLPVLAHTHKYTSTVTKPSCTEKGYTTHKCPCGDSYVDSYVNAKGHIEAVVKGKDATCTETGLTDGKKCSVCGIILIQQETVAAKGHAWDNGKITKEPTETETGIKTFSCASCKETKTETLPVLAHTHKYTATVTKPTCTEKGYTTYTCACGDSYKGDEVKATGHKEKVVKGKDSTCLKTGLTNKVTCSVCQTVLTEQTLIPKKDHKFDAHGCTVCGIKFSDNDGYLALAAFQNGKAMQAFYDELDRIAAEFHASGKDLEASGEIAMVGYVSQNDFGLTLDEAILAFSFYKNDHPNYFWIYPGYGTTNTGSFALVTAAEYCSAASREKHEKLIHNALNEYLALVKDENSAYEMALAFHDKIITDTVYSTTQSDMNSVWAHNVIGVLEKGNGVCESYAKTFQLLLNCVGIENVYVTGVSYGINHVWNLIQLDDGKWYWCDLTWDDDETNALGLGWGISYNYFCVTDTQDVMRYYQDGGYMVDENGDGKQDTANINESHILDFSHHLPKRSDQIFDGSLRDTFTVDGLKFAISGYRTVQFVFTEKTGTVDIPETVEYEGVTYKVTSVGGITEDGIYSRYPVAPYASKINLPKTVVYVWEGAIKK